MVTEQLNHLVLNLTKPGRNRTRPRRRLGPPRHHDGRTGRLPPGRWTAGSRPPRIQRVACRFGAVRVLCRDHQADPPSSEPVGRCCTVPTTPARASPRSRRSAGRGSAGTDEGGGRPWLRASPTVDGPSPADPAGRGPAAFPAEPVHGAEVAEAAELTAGARRGRQAAELPQRLRTRDWDSVVADLLAVDELLDGSGSGRAGAGGRSARPATRSGGPNGRRARRPASLRAHHLPQRRAAARRAVSTTGAASASSPSGWHGTSRRGPSRTPRRMPGPGSTACSLRSRSATPPSLDGTARAATTGPTWTTGAAPRWCAGPRRGPGATSTCPRPGWTPPSTTSTSSRARAEPRWATPLPA